ncbi:hypothetical protein [uncultured Trichococcus sp.]|uniref:hypothetical protein n=1 Tax=uncultured Trichococcus sp. TaxID=189665 RepID=UPI0029C8D6AC|nr:hypothetical protein [uncultured Trichococcus sp.]
MANKTFTILTMLKNTDIFRFSPGISRANFLEPCIRTIPIENCDVPIKMGWIKRTRENITPEAKQFLKSLTKSFSDYILGTRSYAPKQKQQAPKSPI